MSSERSANAETIEQTKQQIRGLVSEISQLSKSDLSPEEYYAAFLQRVVSALAAVGGAIWLVADGRKLQLAYQINLSQTLLDSASDDATRHLRLLNYIVHSNEGNLIPPLSGATDENAGGNPTRYLLVLSPLRGDGQVEGIVEIFQRPDSPPNTQRGYLKFLEQMTELAGEWLKTQKLRQISDKTSLWAQADQFSRLAHESLNLRETAYTVANEGRRLIGCDRVSVALKVGRKCHIEAISGQDTMENRSNIVNALGNLATRVVATGEPLWYEGSTEDLPPQIESAIQHYVDESYAKSIAVLPVRRPGPSTQVQEHGSRQIDRHEDEGNEVIGALIVEQIESDLPRNLLAPRMDLVYEHSARALTNSMDHSNLFLMPVWRTLGKATWVVKSRTLPKTLTIMGLVLAVILILTLVQRDFYMKAKGTLEPVVKRDVFVPRPGGIVGEVKVQDQDLVEEGQLLVVLKNTELDVQVTDTLGQLDATTEQLLSVNAMRRRSELRLSDDERTRLDGQSRELKTRVASLKLQYDLLRQQQQQLKILAPLGGRVMLSWDVEESLLNRTVEPGQVLMTIADPDKDWELELFMKETREGHVDSSLREQLLENAESNLPVKYILATDPGNEFDGQVDSIENITQMHDEEGHSVRIRVGIDESDLVDPRPGTTVRGKVLVGRACIGYTWFHEAVEWVQANLLF